ncbi:winged helix-turn-helix domain-containing protein [Noviherbaspirillum galbum]|uniref:Response regulator transcription factor n=1 Tax=Noviherbaspirillum galbum TaxID=2709383 RepID=A0A6B3SX70_9BURK|nr:winged helix-turn-helix domain-containing protein [Noviherbaspirillum galbum]NEX63062.1 response regulator transcription factor [Noviherbaspirillum galbum]
MQTLTGYDKPEGEKVHINLKIIGKQLFRRLFEESKKEDSAFPRKFRRDELEWKLTYTTTDLTVSDLLCCEDVPSALLIEARNTAMISKIQTLEEELVSFLRRNSELSCTLAPVIFVFQSHESIGDTLDFPEFISDWVFWPVPVEDLSRRILSAFLRKRILKGLVRFGAVTLIPETRSIGYNDQSLRLTPTEYTLAEAFLRKMGTVIPFKDLVMLFQAAGKSTSPNNIRVAIFQLRSKLEALTRSRITLLNVYKQGYCLRQAIRRNTEDYALSVLAREAPLIRASKSADAGPCSSLFSDELEEPMD